MSTKSRQVIFGSRIIGAKIHAEGARERAKQAIREADRAMPQWRLRLAAGEMPSLRDRGQHSASTSATAARYADLEAGGRAEMPVLPNAALLAAGAHDPADGRTADRTLRLGASGRR